MAKLLKKSEHDQELHHKGWGREVWIENRPEYCGKLLIFNHGKKCSMHYHMNKTETMFLQSGRIDIELIEPVDGVRYTVNMFPGDSLLIPRGQLHQIFALKDSELFEFSTVHEDADSYRAWKGD